jgi:aminoglycoside/choline kinase family phosphotransferase
MLSTLQLKDYFDDKDSDRSDFLQNTIWRDAPLKLIAEDCAYRRYFRLSGNNTSAILMESVPDHHEICTPGHNISDFIKIGQRLHHIGIKVPEIYEADIQKGYVLLEDLGDVSLKKAAFGHASRDELYELAIDVLSHIEKFQDEIDLDLPNYYESHVHEGRRRVVDWYMPCVRLQMNPDELVTEYYSIWHQIESSLPDCPQGFLHIDYHFENLMWLPQNQGIQRCGVLDFQGAMLGPIPYDLANVLEDARIDVPASIRSAMLDRYCQSMTIENKELYRAWYRVLATQFHCRVLGQFIKLALRDGKDRYISFVPRVAGYIREGLKDPLLKPLKDWFDNYSIDFTEMLDLESPQIVNSIREDAF